MKILLTSESYWPNKDGGAVFERRLVCQMVAAGHDVVVVAPGARPRGYIEFDDDVKIYRTPSLPLPLNRDNYRISYTAKSAMRRAIDDHNPDIIHVHTMALTGLAALRLAKKRGITIVATNHLMPENVLMSLPKSIRDSERTQRIFWRRIVKFHNKFAAVASPTKTATNLLADNGLTRPLFDITNGVNTDYYRPSDDSVAATKDKRLARFDFPHKKYVLYLGRVNAEKRLDLLIDGYKLAHDSDKNLGLVIAGTGNRLEHLKEQCRRLGIEKDVLFTGFVSDEEKLALYQRALNYAITSPAELQSIASLEAMACGKPIVAVDAIALAELCHDGKNGFLIPFGDAHALAGALLKISQNAALRKKFGKYSRDLVCEKHSQESALRQYLDFYKKAC